MGDRRVGYAPGVYDLFHIGHLNLLRNASTVCDHLIAGVVSDDLAERNKGIRPVVPVDERLAIVEAIRFVGAAVVEDVPHKLEVWEALRFDAIIKGDDWKGTDRGDKLESDFVRGRGRGGLRALHGTDLEQHAPQGAPARARRALTRRSPPAGRHSTGSRANSRQGRRSSEAYT